MRYGLRDGYKTGQRWMRHRTCGAQGGISGFSARRIGQPCLSSVPSTLSELLLCKFFKLAWFWSKSAKNSLLFQRMVKARTGIKQRNLASVGFPEVLSLVESPLWSGSLLDIWIGRIRHNKNKYA